MVLSSFLSFFLSLSLLIIGMRPLWAQRVLTEESATPIPETFSRPTVHALEISAGDLIELDVFDTPELSARLRVDSRCEVTLPLSGTISLRGMTAGQAGRAMESRLQGSEVLNDPHVSVAVVEYATQGITVLGEVKNPGVYPLLGAHGLLDLISAAGGETSSAGKDVTVTHRDEPEHPLIVKVETRAGSAARFNLDVRPGDTIMVSHAGIVYVLGDVGKPGGFLLENNDRLTVLEAIALAQGTNRTASLNRSRLIRKTDAGRVELQVPLKKLLANKSPDLSLEDGDILFIPGSASKNALRDMEGILPAATSAAIFRVP